ncbi:hypothetical protein GCM10007874_02970 [Labrys miyagiensis]|uniref:Uncharacterized protein n=1 Tax=Labrys miyagiensis TaxID=346912 RepID=A0ABQ6CA73_9HYPH|nr:hypothetical protein [Labrys miyagiensis]GLS17282.1 hypothetical protein GCM10007874_02970 [Labrys miyagiensis]
MRRQNKTQTTPDDEMPNFIRDDNYDGPTGNSNDPRDSLWLGFDGKLDIDQLLSLDRDPNDALRQILTAIVRCHSADKSAFEIERRLDAAMAAVLCKTGKRGPKSGFARVEKAPVLHRAAALFYRNRLKGGDPDWKSCIWEALDQKERKRLGADPEDEKFANFYKEAMKVISTAQDQNRQIFWASVEPADAHELELSLPQWRWRQERIDAILNNLQTLGVIPPNVE